MLSSATMAYCSLRKTCLSMNTMAPSLAAHLTSWCYPVRSMTSRTSCVSRRRQVSLSLAGAGTGLSGGAVAASGGITVGFARMRRILEVDAINRLAIVEPGLVNQDLSKAVAHLGLHYIPDPSSQRACTLGGNVTENSGGPHCLAYGVTTNHVLGLEVVLTDGTVTWLGGRGYESPGYDLRGAFIGSEGTLGIVTKIAVRLMPLPEAVITTLAVFNEVEQASRAVLAIIGGGIVPAALEMMDRTTILAVEPAVHAGYPPDAGAVLLIEVDGVREDAQAQLVIVDEVCRAAGARELRCADDGPAASAVVGTQGRYRRVWGGWPQILHPRRGRAAHAPPRSPAPHRRDRQAA